MENLSTRFKNIDIFRFLFAVLIVMFHGRDIIKLPGFLGGIKYCNICVEFFFIISGFLLFYYIEKYNDTWLFIKQKFFRLAPNIWLSIIIVMILSFFIKDISFSFDGNILRIFLLHNVGFTPRTGGSGLIFSWFISCLFWVSIFYFYVNKIFEKKYLNLFIWIIVMVCFAIYAQYNDFRPGGHLQNIYYIFNIGVIRALASMGLGYFINIAFQKNILKNANYYFISFFEIITFAGLFYCLICWGKIPGKSLIVLVLLFSIVFYLFLIKKGILSNIFENNISVHLGKYAYSIYCFHGIVLALFKIYTNHNAQIKTLHPDFIYFGQTLTAILVGVILYHLFEKPVTKLVKKLVY